MEWEDHMALTVGLVTFLAAAIMFLAVWLFAGNDSGQDVIRQRLEAVRKADRRGEATLDFKLIREEVLSSVPLLHRLMMKLSWSGRLQDLLAEAGMKTMPAKILLMAGVFGVGGYVLVAVYFRLGLVGIIVGLLCATLPIDFVLFIRSRRLRAFEERFPEALDLLARAVRAGHPFTTGLEMISKESPEPIAGEFRTTFEEQNFGLPLRDALINLAERVPLVDVRFFVTALLVQKETGGNLAEILDELGRVIRDRFRIYREVQIKTAQGRLTALIMIAMPMVMMGILELLNPTYMSILFRDPLGPFVLGITAVLQVIGSFILWRIVQIKV
jgi:tight adherence protein B